MGCGNEREGVVMFRKTGDVEVSGEVIDLRKKDSSKKKRDDGMNNDDKKDDKKDDMN